MIFQLIIKFLYTFFYLFFFVKLYFIVYSRNERRVYVSFFKTVKSSKYSPLYYGDLISGFIWSEIKQVRSCGFKEYITNLWNILDIISNSFYVCTIILRIVYYITRVNLLKLTHIISAPRRSGREIVFLWNFKNYAPIKRSVHQILTFNLENI